MKERTKLRALKERYSWRLVFRVRRFAMLTWETFGSRPETSSPRANTPPEWFDRCEDDEIAETTLHTIKSA